MSDIEYGPRFRVTEFKSSDSGAEVAGYVSTYGNVDHGGDVVMHGAFENTLKAGTPVRFLWAHDTHEVIGKPLELRSDDKGLFGRFQISQTARGRDIHTLLKDGAVDSFSIGYIPTDVEFDEGGARLLKSLDLLECSVVAMPMNARATVTAVKSDAPPSVVLDENVSFEKLLAQVGEHLTIAAEAAEALQARRAEDGRKLATTHIDAINELLDKAEADFERLEHIAAPPPPSPPDEGLKRRMDEMLESARKRGLLET